MNLVKSKVVLLPCREYDEEKIYMLLKQGLDFLGGVETLIPKDAKILLKPNLLKKAEKLDELQTRMKEIYGEGEELLETFVSGLEQYNSQQEEHPFKARLLTNETVDEWEAYQRAKSEERLIELPTKIIRDGVSCPMVYHFYNVPYPEEEDIEECHLFEYIYKDSQLYLSVSAGPYSTVSIEATEIGESVFFSKEEALRKIHEIHRDYEIVDDKVIPRQRTKQKKD